MSRRHGLPILLTALTMVSSHAADVSAAAAGEMKHGDPSALWSRSVAVRGSTPSHVTIEGAEIDGRFVPQAVSIPDDEPDKISTPLPLGTNLLDRLEPQPFGGEERVKAVRSKVGLTIRCGEGIAPAGVVLKTGASHFLRAAHLRLVAAGGGSGEPLGLSLVEQAGDAPTPSQALTGPDGVSLKIPPSPADDPRDLVINCPPGQASFRLNSLSLEPGPATSQTSRTGTWLWEAEAWLAQPAKIEEWAVAAPRPRLPATADRRW